jgi:hypothetical protein
MKYLSLFSGIGGFKLGIQQAYEEISSIKKQGEGVQRRQEKKHLEMASIVLLLNTFWGISYENIQNNRIYL